MLDCNSSIINHSGPNGPCSHTIEHSYKVKALNFKNTQETLIILRWCTCSSHLCDLMLQYVKTYFYNDVNLFVLARKYTITVTF